MSYETDIVVWANKQAWFLRHKQFDLLDIEHLAEEIDDIARREQRELTRRIAVLIAHLLKWQFQPERRGVSWERTIREQRKALDFHLKQVPSLKTKLADEAWQAAVWADAVTLAIKEMGTADFPENCPWTMDEVLSQHGLLAVCP